MEDKTYAILVIKISTIANINYKFLLIEAKTTDLKEDMKH